jgi:hypothetical protein
VLELISTRQCIHNRLAASTLLSKNTTHIYIYIYLKKLSIRCKKRVRYLTSSFHTMSPIRRFQFGVLTHNLYSIGFTFNINCRNCTLHCLVRAKFQRHFYMSAFSYLFLHSILFRTFRHSKHASEITHTLKGIPFASNVGFTDHGFDFH